MSECAVVEIEAKPSVMERLGQTLASFADRYEVLPVGAKVSDEVKAYLKAFDAVNTVVKAKPLHFITKQAEREANQSDRTVRYGREFASVLLEGDRWERVLAEKNWDLCKMFRAIVRNLTALETVASGTSDPYVGAYADFFANRLGLAVNGAEIALKAIYKGASCWMAFETVRKSLSRTLAQAAEIRESYGANVAREIVEWCKKNTAAKLAA
jgi:hypothetical protein